MKSKNHKSSNQKSHTHRFSQSKARPQSQSRSQSQPHSQAQAKAKPQSLFKDNSSLNKSWRQVAGTHAIKELLKIRPQSVKQAFLQKELMSTQELKEYIQIFKEHRISFDEKSEPDLYKICPSHQGAVVFSDYNPAFDYSVADWNKQSLILALDGVEDPHNLGAILRTSWLMGVSGIIIPQDRAVGLTATVHKVACGGVEHVSVARINNFSDPITELKEAGFWVYGLSHKAKKTIHDIQYPDKVIWVLGAEDKGIRTTTEKNCDELVSIPQVSPEASYNVSVATAIALMETKRQWMQQLSKLSVKK